MKMIKKAGFFAAFMMVFSTLTGFGISSATSQDLYPNPNWAPPYSPGVRYYYLPDIETYYDLQNHDFAYLDNGQWLFSNTLPPQYGSYDLYNGFAVALDVNVYQPWMHHHFYVANYPRYYYRNVYREQELVNIRGFNENQRAAFYWNQEDRRRTEDFRRNARVDERRENSRPPQRTNYYGKNIGAPVKVRTEMRDNRDNRNSRDNRANRDNRDNRGQKDHH